jgi:hypothetical protein
MEDAKGTVAAAKALVLAKRVWAVQFEHGSCLDIRQYLNLPEFPPSGVS